MKKGFLPGEVIIILIILAALMVFVFVWIFPRITGSSEKITAGAPNADEICLQATQIKASLGKSVVDTDKDGRDDSCDWCVCADGCNNDKDDKDGDKLPAACDKNDDPAKGGMGVQQFDTTKCSNKFENLFKISSGWQCYNPKTQP